MEENKVENKIENKVENNSKRGNLAIFSFICLIMKIATVIAFVTIDIIFNPKGFISDIMVIAALFPWLLISLILAIIGKVKDNDKMSKVLMIIDIVFLVLEILSVILLFVFLISGMIGIYNYVMDGLKGITAY